VEDDTLSKTAGKKPLQQKVDDPTDEELVYV
jgi:hypothetical protein